MNLVLLFASGKQCLPLLTADGQLPAWLALPALVLFVWGVLGYLRAVGKARSRVKANGGTVVGVFVGCAVLLGVGWLAIQFFDPTC